MEIGVRIPGIISIEHCMVESVIPTFSKEQTTKGLPLFCKIDMTVMSFGPATTDVLEVELRDQALAQLSIL